MLFLAHCILYWVWCLLCVCVRAVQCWAVVASDSLCRPHRIYHTQTWVNACLFRDFWLANCTRLSRCPWRWLKVLDHNGSSVRAPGLVRIDLLRFLAGCRKRRLNQALLFVCSVSWLFLLGCQYQCKWLTGKTRLRNDLQYVDGDVKPTHSLLTVGWVTGSASGLKGPAQHSLTEDLYCP